MHVYTATRECFKPLLPLTLNPKEAKNPVARGAPSPTRNRQHIVGSGHGAHPHARRAPSSTARAGARAAAPVPSSTHISTPVAPTTIPVAISSRHVSQRPDVQKRKKLDVFDVFLSERRCVSSFMPVRPWANQHGSSLPQSGKKPLNAKWRPYSEACDFAQRHNFKTAKEYNAFCATSTGNRPPDVPAEPDRTYVSHGWVDWWAYLGTAKPAGFKARGATIGLDVSRTIRNRERKRRNSRSWAATVKGRPPFHLRSHARCMAAHKRQAKSSARSPATPWLSRTVPHARSLQE